MKKLREDSYEQILNMICNHPCGTVYPLSVAEHRQSGDIFICEDSVLCWHYSGFAYLFGSCGDAFLEQVYQEFLIADRLPRRFVLFTANPRTEQFFRNHTGLAFGRRYQFDFPETAFSPKPVPAELALRQIDRELFDSVAGRVTPRFSWRNAEEFLSSGMGYCLMYNGTPASWAFSAAVSTYETDIGIETAPEFRHRGLAFLAAEQMTASCLRQGRKPVWACDTGNTASRNLAERLGFSIAAEYTTIRKDA